MKRLAVVAIVLLAPASAVSARNPTSFTGRGVVDAAEAAFEVQQPEGALCKFTLTVVNCRLQGDLAGERDGVVRRHASVDAEVAAKVKSAIAM
jgi:hypothetical protein